MSGAGQGGARDDGPATQRLQTVLLERRGRVALVQLHRPKAPNALNDDLMREVVRLTAALDADPGVGAIVITGSERAFAAGADIKEMQAKAFADVFNEDLFAPWDALSRVRTPSIAAVAGFALGGGCELAMTCDVLLAADTAVFGQPEVKLGVSPGIGGSQRLTHAVGKAKAMEMCLTGRTMDVVEAERAGLVSRIVPADRLSDEAWSVAEATAGMSKPVTVMVKWSTRPSRHPSARVWPSNAGLPLGLLREPTGAGTGAPASGRRRSLG